LAVGVDFSSVEEIDASILQSRSGPRRAAEW
jgi:hypothetical protein